LTVTEKVMLLSVVVGMKPEKKASVVAPTWHGVAKDPEVTVWFAGKKLNSRTSPTAAVTVLGEKASSLLSPTVIGMVFAKAPETRAEAATVYFEKNMVKLFEWW